MNGLPALDIETPALLLDLQRLEGNLERMAKFFREGPHGCDLTTKFTSAPCSPIVK